MEAFVFVDVTGLRHESKFKVFPHERDIFLAKIFDSCESVFQSVKPLE